MKETSICPDGPGKPVISILTSHDSTGRNRAMVRVLDYLVERQRDAIKGYQLAITRGSFRRIIDGVDKGGKKFDFDCVRPETREFLLEECGILRLPCRRHGGVVLMANLIVNRKSSIVWPFLTPTTPHWLTPENLALMRLCDQCHANRLMNEQSVIEWACAELASGAAKSAQPVPPTFGIGGLTSAADFAVPMLEQGDGSFAIDWKEIPRGREGSETRTLALIAHNEMKARIEEFVVDYQVELAKFKRIITTGTTGKIVVDAAPKLAGKVRRYNSGPKGGDIEIAAEMIFGQCDVAVFLVDPLSPHPHSDDIQVLFGAATLNGSRLLTNERQARAWMERTGGDVDDCSDFAKWVLGSLSTTQE